MKLQQQNKAALIGLQGNSGRYSEGVQTQKGHGIVFALRLGCATVVDRIIPLPFGSITLVVAAARTGH